MLVKLAYYQPMEKEAGLRDIIESLKGFGGRNHAELFNKAMGARTAETAAHVQQEVSKRGLLDFAKDLKQQQAQEFFNTQVASAINKGQHTLNGVRIPESMIQNAKEKIRPEMLEAANRVAEHMKKMPKLQAPTIQMNRPTHFGMAAKIPALPGRVKVEQLRGVA